jgi:hypothetical protein
MTKNLLILIILMLVPRDVLTCQTGEGKAAPGQHSYRPKQGYVPDATTAIAIAEAVWLPIYGKKTLDQERPFQAVLKNDVWTVTGTLHSRHKDVRGGVAVAEISRIDARVFRVSHGM